jgi:hypothetical protein
VSSQTYTAGTLTAGSSTFTITGDGDFIIASGCTPTVTAASLVLQGTGILTLAKANTRWLNITLANTGKVTTYSGSTTNCGLYYNTGQLTVGAGTWTINSLFYVNTYSTQNTPMVINPSATINGSAGITWQYQGTATSSLNVPALNLGGSLYFSIDCATAATFGTVTYNFTGNISLSGIFIIIGRYGVDFVINTNDFAVTATELRMGTNSATSNFTFNAGNSVFAISSYTDNYNAAAATYIINLGTSVWTCTGNWTWQSNATLSANTSRVTFNTNSANITCAGKSFYNVVFNGATKTYSCLDAFSANNVKIEPGTTLKLFSGATSTITTYNAGDWDGAAGNLTYLTASTAGVQALLSMPAGRVYFMSIKDSSASNLMLSLISDGCVDALNNTNWLFKVGGTVIAGGKSVWSTEGGYRFEVVPATMTTGATMSTAINTIGFNALGIEVPTFSCTAADVALYLYGASTVNGTYRPILAQPDNATNLLSSTTGVYYWAVRSCTGNYTLSVAGGTVAPWIKLKLDSDIVTPMIFNVLMHN